MRKDDIPGKASKSDKEYLVTFCMVCFYFALISLTQGPKQKQPLLKATPNTYQ